MTILMQYVLYLSKMERKIYYSEIIPVVYLEPFEYLFLEYCQHIIRQENHLLKLEMTYNMVEILYDPIGRWSQQPKRISVYFTGYA